MISAWVSARLTARGIHYGWVVVAVTFFTALVSSASVGAPGVFILPLEKRIRLEHHADFVCAVDPPAAVRADGSLCGSADGALRIA